MSTVSIKAQHIARLAWKCMQLVLLGGASGAISGGGAMIICVGIYALWMPAFPGESWLKSAFSLGLLFGFFGALFGAVEGIPAFLLAKVLAGRSVASLSLVRSSTLVSLMSCVACLFFAAARYRLERPTVAVLPASE